MIMTMMNLIVIIINGDSVNNSNKNKSNKLIN